MTINTGVKGTLAKLLATEDLVIEHKKCETASFDVNRRVLTLPVWERASEDVYDLLVAHEVGHALYTPQDWYDFGCPQSYVNITEDARVEKLMKRRYAGLPKTFYRGYKQFDADDFFCVKDNVDTLNLADRINLHFKIGSFTPIPIDEKYSYIVDMVSNAETFDDAVAAAKEIWRVVKEEQEKQQSVAQTASQGGDDQVDTDPDQKQEFPNSESNEQEGSQGSSTEPSDEDVDGDELDTGLGGAHDYLESQTDKAFNENVKNLASSSQYNIEYVELPEFKYEHVVLDCKKLLDVNRDHFEYFTEDVKYAVDDYNAFRKSSQKEVNFLLKEFECRKAASMYSRASTSRTGVLDTQKLHTYKFSDDLFKKVSVLPEGKNHGMIFILDWSGSMSDYLVETVNQVIQLVWFCQKANIEFDVYAFTNDGGAYSALPRPEGSLPMAPTFDAVPNTLSLRYSTMLHMVSSSQSKRDQDSALKYLFFNAGCNGNRPGTHWKQYHFAAAPYMGLSGTPLIESIITLKALIPLMKKRAEKVTVCVLTDGEAQNVGFVSGKYSYNGEPYINAVGSYVRIRSRKTGKIYPKFDNDPVEHTNTLLNVIKDLHPDVNLLGFRLVSGRDTNQFFRRVSGWNDSLAHERSSTFRKDKGIALSDTGYDMYYVLPTTGKVETLDISGLDSGVDRATATRAFKKMFSNKRSNKRIMTSFIETVA